MSRVLCLITAVGNDIIAYPCSLKLIKNSEIRILFGVLISSFDSMTVIPLSFNKIILISALFSCMAFCVSCDSSEKTETTISEVVSEQTAMDKINSAIVEDPNNLDLFLKRADLFELEGKVEKALADYERALRLDSGNAEIFQNRGNLHYLNSKLPLALDDFERCIELDAENEECLLKKAEIDLLKRNYNEALTNINNALRVNQNNAHAYFMKGMLFKETGDTAASASSYATAIELNPEFYDAYIQVALLYAYANDDLALEYYNSALELRPTSTEALYNKAMYLQENPKGDSLRFQNALECYLLIEDIDDANAAASFNRGYIYLEILGHYDSAATAFSEALVKYPTYYQAFYNRGLCYESLGDFEEALMDYNRVLALEPTYGPAARAKGRVLKEK
ncbi:MAG: tetratricopeptide (TPR) repeat protein [Flavobacteriales bacterium]|jgi:tetratricopeptide (TPR) repeat protein